ncbi:hypothetical protein ACQY74_000486 (plasmid) [Rhizobium leguminosarum bv. trifolii]
MGPIATRRRQISRLHSISLYIAGRAFERRFELADHVKVETASLTNGLLSIELQREIPEAMKPRRIAIGGNAETQAPLQIEGEKHEAA